MPDDIRTEPFPAGQSEGNAGAGAAKAKQKPARPREVGPESEVRGGPEAPQDEPVPGAPA